MNYNLAFSFALAALFLFPVAHGQVANVLNLNGILACPPSSPGSPAGPGLAGELLSLNCSVGGLITTVAQIFTGPNGVFNLSLLNLSQPVPLDNGQLPCEIGLNLPLDNIVCPILSTLDGTLTAILVPVGFLVDDLLGLIVNVVAGLFVNLNVGI